MNLEQKILKYVNRPEYRPVKISTLVKKLKKDGVVRSSKQKVADLIEKLIQSGELCCNEAGRIQPCPSTVTSVQPSSTQLDSDTSLQRASVVRSRRGVELLAGIVKRTARGTGIFIPHEADETGLKEIFIRAEDMRDAHTGDEVLVRLLKRRGAGGRRYGRVEEILERATNQFVGTYFEAGGSGYVQVDGTNFNEPILVGDAKAKGVRQGDKVVLEMLRYPSWSHAGEGVITKVLGPRDKPEIDEQTVIHQFSLQEEFSEDALEEAREQARRFNEEDLQDRLDLTKEIVVTIDPADARDFDDAISLTRNKNGYWRLGVHIADVAHFVKAGGALDREALQRGTSVYLPGRVLPMLPELISNGLASLQQGRVRYTKSVFIEFTPEGIPVHVEFARSAIRVTRRFAYEQIMPIVREPERFRTRVSAKVRKLLSMMYELAMILRQRRLQAGALELNLPEVELELGKQGEVVGAHTVEHDESHQIIEEFMLAANIAVAQELNDRGIRFLRRIHPPPSPHKLKAFAQFVSVLGYKLKNYRSRFELQELLQKVKNTPHEEAVNYALLRSMKQAEYSEKTLGHYALAVEHYCHFTSPIRRYPDLTVHRLLDEILDGRKRVRGPSELELARLGKLCSLAERKAEAAERELVKLKLLRYFENRIGERMKAVITGVERFGLFCRGVDLPVEGFIHLTWLSEKNDYDYFYYDPTAMSLIGRRTGRVFHLGQVIDVVVSHVDLERRELDFTLADPSRPQKRKSTKKKKKTGSSKQTTSSRAKSSPNDQSTKPSSKRKRKNKKR